ncbi:MAG: DNA methylase, partial [Oscillospiraceae bacterium]|nr:DNA methylase [Oscillospiraceae bacterium]
RIKDADGPETVPEAVQMDLFSDYGEETPAMSDEESKKESDLQRSLLEIKNRFGKNAVLKGMSLREGATGRQRNEQIGGHKE